MTWGGERLGQPRLILLNGLPGAGKSTLAARYRDEHPGVLLVEADVLRTWIGGDPADQAEASRMLSLALAGAHLTTGHDVVMPQLVADPDQLERFPDAARGAGAAFVHVLLDAGTRPQRPTPDHDRYVAGLTDLKASSELTLLDASGDEDTAYAALLAVLAPRPRLVTGP